MDNAMLALELGRLLPAADIDRGRLRTELLQLAAGTFTLGVDTVMERYHLR